MKTTILATAAVLGFAIAAPFFTATGDRPDMLVDAGDYGVTNKSADAGDYGVTNKSADAGDYGVTNKSADAGDYGVTNKSADAGDYDVTNKSADAGDYDVTNGSAPVSLKVASGYGPGNSPLQQASLAF